MIKLAIILLILSVQCLGQGWISHTETYMSAPTGVCVPGTIAIDMVGKALYVCPTSGTWASATISNQPTFPSGFITFVSSGSCPSGFSEITALNGKMLRGTLAANSDVGATGGNATITPTGTVSTPTFTGSAGTIPAETFTGSAGTVPAQTFTGSSATTSAVSAGTPAGTNGATTTSGNCAATNIAAGTGSTTACKGTAPNLTVPAETFSGSALGTHTHTLTATGTNGTVNFTPSGNNSTANFTPAGTVSQPTFSGNAVDPSPSYIKVIFCSAN